MALVVVNNVDHNGKNYGKGEVLPTSLVDKDENLNAEATKREHEARKAALLEIGAVVEADNAADAVKPEPTQAELQASPNPEALKAEGGQPLQASATEDQEEALG
jgi:hypothetical protein